MSKQDAVRAGGRMAESATRSAPANATRSGSPAGRLSAPDWGRQVAIGAVSVLALALLWFAVTRLLVILLRDVWRLSATWAW